jgi:Ni2+-binding GTPase involved in maturation of urease and hydrogenase
MKPVKLLFVGGFLGAGKTTLLWAAAKRLMGRGLRVGLIGNDQAPDLVDTALLRERGLEVREVVGSCFCCNFDGLLGAASELIAASAPDVLIAEPVGSCADLSATLLQPLKDKHDWHLTPGPLTVLADPDRLRDCLSARRGELHPSSVYIVRKQLEEADTIVLSKADLALPEARRALERRLAEAFPDATVRQLSARTGEGLDEWLDAVLRPGAAAGLRVVDVDYDTYAEGEAVLGWLNAEIELRRSRPGNWRPLCAALLQRLQRAFARRRAGVGHVKAILLSKGGYIVGNLTSVQGEPNLQGSVRGSDATARLILNARVGLPPAELEAEVRSALADATGRAVVFRVAHMHSLSPGRPNPTHRYARPVTAATESQASRSAT